MFEKLINSRRESVRQDTTTINANVNIENKESNPKKEKRNLVRFHGEAATSAVEDAAVGYQAPSVIAVGANAQSVSMLATLVNLCLSIICLKAPMLIERIGVTKRGSIVLAISNMLTWIPLIIVFFLAKFGITPLWVAILWLINIMPGMLLSFQKDNWLSNIVPGNMMGKYLGQRLAIKSLFYLAAFFLFGYLMDSMGQNNLFSFGFVFLIATSMTLIYSLIYSKMYDPATTEGNPVKTEALTSKFNLFDYASDLKNKKLDKFVIFTALINISIGLGGPLYAVYMLQEQSFSYMSYTIIIAVEFLARIISSPFWGRFADKEGNIKVLKIVSRIVPALPICWLFSTNIAYLAVIQILSGICWGAFDLSTQSYLYKVAPPPKKLSYIVYTRSLMLFAVAVGGLAGSFLVKDIFEIFGSRLLTVFMISGFLRAVIVMFLMPKIIDLAINYGIPEKVKMALSLVKKPAASKHGLFYHTQEPVMIKAEEPVNMHKRNPAMEQKLMEAHAAKKQLELLTEAVQNGHKRNWALEAAAKAQAARTQAIKDGIKEHVSSAKDKGPVIDLSDTVRRKWVFKDMEEQQVREPVQSAEVKPSRRPWFGDEEILENYKARVPVLAAAGNNNMTVDISGGRGGLFYNDEGWARYKEESMKAVIKEKEQSKAALKPKSLFIESSYPWRNSY